jgi:NAD(P)-dependent dehydrogenase (short-subunit alcohol dehydrogenase family)
MKTAVITGATSGIGFAAAQALADQGWRVIGVGHSKKNSEAAKARLLRIAPEADITFVYGDLAQQSEVHRIADEVSALLNKQGGMLDALISNAGGVRNWYTTTEQGYELQFALNHLAGFLLTYRLLPHLIGSGGKLILTGSGSHKHMRIRWNDIMFEKRYSPLFAYKQSKLANMLFAKEFNRRYSDEGIRAYVVDPGLVNTDIGSKQTGGLTHLFWELRKKNGVSPDKAAQTYKYLCGLPEHPEGLYYRDCEPSAYSRYADNEEHAKQLFDLSEQLCGITFERSIKE